MKLILGILLSIAFLIGSAIVSSCLQGHKPAFVETEERLLVAPKEWRRIELDYFSFSIPADFKMEDVQSDDSALWVYSNSSMKLEVDFGVYSDDLQLYRHQPDYQEEFVRIAGRRAKTCSFRLDDSFVNPIDSDRRFIAAAHFSGLGDSPMKLTFWASCKGTGEQEVAKTIFQSIKFKKSLK